MQSLTHEQFREWLAFFRIREDLHHTGDESPAAGLTGDRPGTGTGTDTGALQRKIMQSLKGYQDRRDQGHR